MPRIAPRSIVRSVPLAALAVALCSAACQPTDPQVRVAQIRSQYTVKLSSWLPLAAEPETTEPEITEPEAELAEPVPETPPLPLGEEAPVEAGPRPTTIAFDVLISFDGNEPLPGITLDITHADPFQKEKDHRRHWIDTSRFRKGSTEQIDFQLGGFDFIEGDVFSVDLLQNVPAEVRGEYREFAEAVQ